MPPDPRSLSARNGRTTLKSLATALYSVHTSLKAGASNTVHLQRTVLHGLCMNTALILRVTIEAHVVCSRM